MRAASPTPERPRRVSDRQRNKVDEDAPDVCVARRAAEQWGVLTTEELVACGLSRRAIVTRSRNGRLHRVHRGVYAVGHPSLPLEGVFVAAVKACGPAAALSHRASAALRGMIDWENGRYPEVSVPGDSTRVHPGIKVHRTRRLDRRDVVRWRGIPITTPARTLLDLAAELPSHTLRRAIRRAQGLGVVSVPQLLEVLERLGPRPGSARLRSVIATGPAPTRSVLEDVVLDLILSGGLAHPDVNMPLAIAGRRIIPDFRWPERRLIVEADGVTWHDGEIAREDDAERQALLEAAGERVLRVTWKQAVGSPRRTLTRFREAGAPDADAPASTQLRSRSSTRRAREGAR